MLNPSRACHCEEPVRATPILSEVEGSQSLNSKGGDCFAHNDRSLANVILSIPSALLRINSEMNNLVLTQLNIR